jgi:hypothetical protein
VASGWPLSTHNQNRWAIELTLGQCSESPENCPLRWVGYRCAQLSPVNANVLIVEAASTRTSFPSETIRSKDAS